MAWPRESFRPTLTLIVLFGAVLVVFVTILAALVLALVTGQVPLGARGKPPQLPIDFVLWSQYAVYVPLATYFLVVVRPVSRLSFAALGFGPPSWRNLGTAALGAVAMWISVTLVATIVEAVTHLHTTEAAVLLMRQIHTFGQQLLFIAMAVV